MQFVKVASLKQGYRLAVYLDKQVVLWEVALALLLVRRERQRDSVSSGSDNGERRVASKAVLRLDRTQVPKLRKAYRNATPAYHDISWSQNDVIYVKR